MISLTTWFASSVVLMRAWNMRLTWAKEAETVLVAVRTNVVAH